MSTNPYFLECVNILSTTTGVGKVAQAKHFINDYLAAPEKYWMGVGGVLDWEIPSAPPVPDYSMSIVLPGVVSFFWIHRCVLCTPSSEGDLETPEGRFQSLDHTKDLRQLAMANGWYVFVQAKCPPLTLINYEFDKYRAIGITRDIRILNPAVSQPTYEEGASLHFEELEFYLLDWIAYMPPRDLTDLGADATNYITIVKEF
jgi:hypothetical protein